MGKAYLAGAGVMTTSRKLAWKWWMISLLCDSVYYPVYYTIPL